MTLCTACNDFHSVRAEGAGPGQSTGFPCERQEYGSTSTFVVDLLSSRPRLTNPEKIVWVRKGACHLRVH